MIYNFPEREKEILKFWQDNKIFEKLREKNAGKKRWSFLDGPITANNPMGVHHAWGRTLKDIFQRYKAMQGYEQRYQNGFDCQGLWVEVEVEKELGFKNKKDIEVYGIDKFVEKCKERVRKYSKVQTDQSIRLGQWMDWPNSYYTMSDENNYAIWHFLKKCWQLGYLYKGRDSVPWCPRCGTAISQHEILTEEYQLITHKAVYFKLPITEGKLKGKRFLVWTTTPWTILANVALAVNPEFEYGIYKGHGEELILLKDLAEKILPVRRSLGQGGGKDYIFQKKIKGEDLRGIKYQGPFDELPRVQKAKAVNPDTFHTVVLDKDLVTQTEGTGIVHLAPGAGQEDFKIGKRESLAVIEVIDESAVYLGDLGEFSQKNAKEHPELILNYLKTYQNGQFFFKAEEYSHRYPTCWRCKTELVWRVVEEWYISMDKLRKPLEDITKKIKWIPQFGLDRELDWLKNMQDWLISKKRYWGLVLPVFECVCGNFEVIGSREELKKRAVDGWQQFEGHSPHRPWVDNIKIKCKKCKNLISRIKDVGNPWLDAGIVPFSTIKYFSNKRYWRKWFPAELICESFPGQFKNWFYSLLVMSVVLENKEPVKTIFGYASVRDEKGEEMHKSKGNAIWFDEAVEKMGADSMRFLYARHNPAENLNFGYNLGNEIKRKLLILYNVYAFFNIYVSREDIPNYKATKTPVVAPLSGTLRGKNILDRWIISKINHLLKVVEFNLDDYNVAKAALAIEDFFINDLSLWYVRRSRKRFHSSINVSQTDRKEAITVLYYVLLNLTKLIAPIMPFFAEKMYQDLRIHNLPESVHLLDWSKKQQEGQTDLDLEEKMKEVRDVVNLALAERSVKEIKVRQPLQKLKIKNQKLKIKDNSDLLELIKEEVNVKEIVFDSKIKNEVELDTTVTKELKEEGMIRDIIRYLQDMRKSAGLKPKDKILVSFFGSEKITKTLDKNKELVLREINATKFLPEKETNQNYMTKEFMVDNQKLLIKIKKLK